MECEAMDPLILDGSQIRSILPSLNDRLASKDLLKKKITCSEFKDVAESEAVNIMFGNAVLPPNFKFYKLVAPPDFSEEDALLDKLSGYLSSLADHLRDEPLIVDILDGSMIKTQLEDEDDFAMLAEELFMGLDKDDTGKVSKREVRNALVRMGTDMGVPPFAGMPEAESLLKNVLKKHVGEGTEELGQSQFAQLLQDVLEDLYEKLASKPLAIFRHIKVVNGSQARKVLSNEEFLQKLISTMFIELDVNKDGKISKTELRPLFERKCSELGLPSFEGNDTVSSLYDQIFTIADEDASGSLEKNEFEMLVKNTLQAFAELLAASPVFYNVEPTY